MRRLESAAEESQGYDSCWCKRSLSSCTLFSQWKWTKALCNAITTKREVGPTKHSLSEPTPRTERWETSRFTVIIQQRRLCHGTAQNYDPKRNNRDLDSRSVDKEDGADSEQTSTKAACKLPVPTQRCDIEPGRETIEVHRKPRTESERTNLSWSRYMSTFSLYNHISTILLGPLHFCFWGRGFDPEFWCPIFLCFDVGAFHFDQVISLVFLS